MEKFYDDEYDYSAMRQNSSDWEDITEFECVETEDLETIAAVDAFLATNKW